MKALFFTSLLLLSSLWVRALPGSLRSLHEFKNSFEITFEDEYIVGGIAENQQDNSTSSEEMPDADSHDHPHRRTTNTLCSSVGTDLSIYPILKTVSVHYRGENSNDGFRFVRYPDGYRFGRKPALQAFQFNDKYGHLQLQMIGVRAEVHGVNFWFRDDGNDYYDGHADVVQLPFGTWYGQGKAIHSSNGNHCVASTKRIHEGQCTRTAVLRGYSLEYLMNARRRVNHMKVRVKTYYSSGECRVLLESCLGDWNHDDPFEAWVYFALVPNWKIKETGEDSGTIAPENSGGVQLDNTQNTNPYPFCSYDGGQQPALTMFEFEKMDRNWFSATDMLIDKIGAGVYNKNYGRGGVKSWASLFDSQKDDRIDWSIGYAVIED
jgi:hypothetical protein